MTGLEVIFVIGLALAMFIAYTIADDIARRSFLKDALDANIWKSEFDKYPEDKNFTVDEAMELVYKDVVNTTRAIVHAL